MGLMGNQGEDYHSIDHAVVDNDGDLILEWGTDKVAYTAALMPDGRMTLIADNLDTDALFETTVEMDVGKLIEFIKEKRVP